MRVFIAGVDGYLGWSLAMYLTTRGPEVAGTDLGYLPTHSIEAEIETILNELMKYKHRIEARAHVLVPDVRWDGSRRKVSYL